MMLLANRTNSKAQVAIEDAIKGNNYECMLCKGKVAPVKGDCNSHHFRHVTGKQSGYKSGETPLHIYAKKFLMTHRMLYMPDGRVVIFDRIEVESYQKQGIKIDSVGYSGRRAYLIEFAVSHKVDRKKLEILRTMNLDVIEVNLSSWRKPCPTQASPTAINDIIFQYAPRQWLQRRRLFPSLYRMLRYFASKVSLRRTLNKNQSHEPEQLSLHFHVF